MKNKPIVITCPKCGKEYMPSQIFIPKYFFGEPISIDRDNDRKIVGYIGTDMDTNETFCCDECNTEFHIKTKISFTTTINSIDFDNDYERKI